MIIRKTEGLIAAPMTAFGPYGTVNLDIIPSYAQLLHSNGVVGAFVNGTTGEGFSLTVEDRKAIAERWVKDAPDGFKIIIHVSHTSSVSVQEMARHAARIGASGISEMAPLFYKPGNVENLAEYIAQTASNAPELAYYYYHMPAMSGVCFPMIDLLHLAESKIPNFAGLKYTHENLVDYELCREFGGQKYDILYGRDETLLCSLALGCRGAVGSTYNVMAPLYTQLIDAFDSGNLEEASRLQRISMKVIRLLIETNCFFSGLKEIMKMVGLDMGGVRSPLKNIEATESAALRKNLDELGFSDFCSKLLSD